MSNCKLVTTGGSTGKNKNIYYDLSQQIKLQFPDLINNILRLSKKPLYMHHDVHGTTHDTYEINFPVVFPNVTVARYKSSEDALSYMKEADVIYIEDQVSSFRRIIYLIEDALSNVSDLRKIMCGKILIIELGGDPVSLDELKSFYSRIKQIFGTGPDIAMTYGLVETQDVGVFVLQPWSTSLKYRVFNNKFIEVLDTITREPVVGSEGEIVITPMYWEKGTLLPRYETGDIGMLEFFDDVPYLTVKGRISGKGVLSFSTAKISILGLSEILRKSFEYPIKIQAQILEEENSLYSTLKIVLSSPAFVNENASLMSKEFLSKFIIKEYNLANDIHQGYRKLAIDTTTDDNLEKEWCILPKEIITTS
jgi:hypothetical protein